MDRQVQSDWSRLPSCTVDTVLSRVAVGYRLAKNPKVIISVQTYTRQVLIRCLLCLRSIWWCTQGWFWYSKVCWCGSFLSVLQLIANNAGRKLIVFWFGGGVQCAIIMLYVLSLCDVVIAKLSNAQELMQKAFKELELTTPLRSLHQTISSPLPTNQHHDHHHQLSSPLT